MEYQEILKKLPEWMHNPLEELVDGWFQTPGEFLEAVKTQSDELTEAIHQWADGQVSVYTAARYEWAARYPSSVAEYEEEAISSGCKTVDAILAWCWFRTEEDRMDEIIAKFKAEIE